MFSLCFNHKESDLFAAVEKIKMSLVITLQKESISIRRAYGKTDLDSLLSTSLSSPSFILTPNSEENQIWLHALSLSIKGCELKGRNAHVGTVWMPTWISNWSNYWHLLYSHRASHILPAGTRQWCIVFMSHEHILCLIMHHSDRLCTSSAHYFLSVRMLCLLKLWSCFGAERSTFIKLLLLHGTRTLIKTQTRLKKHNDLHTSLLLLKQRRSYR